MCRQEPFAYEVIRILDRDPSPDRLIKRELFNSEPADQTSKAIALISLVDGSNKSVIYCDPLLQALARSRRYIIWLQ